MCTLRCLTRGPRRASHFTLLFISLFLQTLNNIAYTFIEAYVPSFAEGVKGVDPASLGFIFSVFSFAIFGFAPIFGAVGQNWGYRVNIVFGLLIEAIALVAIAFAADINDEGGFLGFLIVCRLVEGLGSAMTQTGCYALIAAESDGGSHGSSMGYMELMAGVGQISGPIIGGSLFALSNNFALPPIAISIAFFISFITTLLVIPAPKQVAAAVDVTFLTWHTDQIAIRNSGGYGGLGDLGAGADGEQSKVDTPGITYANMYSSDASASNRPISSRQELPSNVIASVGKKHTKAMSVEEENLNILSVLRLPGVIMSGVAAFSGLCANSFIAPTLELYLEEHFGEELSKSEMSLFFCINSFAFTVFAPIAGTIADTYGPKVSIWIGFVGLSITLLFIGPSPLLESAVPVSLTVLAIALFFLGVFVALIVIPTFPDMIETCKHMGHGTITPIASLSASVFSLGEMLGPFFGSYLTGTYSFGTCATCLSMWCGGMLSIFSVLILTGVVDWVPGASQERHVQSIIAEFKNMHGGNESPDDPSGGDAGDDSEPMRKNPLAHLKKRTARGMDVFLMDQKVQKTLSMDRTRSVDGDRDRDRKTQRTFTHGGPARGSSSRYVGPPQEDHTTLDGLQRSRFNRKVTGKVNLGKEADKEVVHLTANNDGSFVNSPSLDSEDSFSGASFLAHNLLISYFKEQEGQVPVGFGPRPLAVTNPHPALTKASKHEEGGAAAEEDSATITTDSSETENARFAAALQESSSFSVESNPS